MFATARKRSSFLDHARLIKPRDKVALMQTRTMNQTIAIMTQEKMTQRVHYTLNPKQNLYTMLGLFPQILNFLFAQILFPQISCSPRFLVRLDSLFAQIPYSLRFFIPLNFLFAQISCSSKRFKFQAISCQKIINCTIELMNCASCTSQ